MSESLFERGIVSRKNNGTVFVAIPENESCEHCGAKIICAPDSGKERGIYASNPVNAEIGQHVEVVESQDLMLKMSVIQYGLPLLGFLGGVFLLYFTNLSIPGIASELSLFLGGLGGLGIASFVSRSWAGKIANGEEPYFKISKIYNGDKI